MKPANASSVDTVTITSSRYGPHYGAQGNILAGKAPFEFTGSTVYENSPHTPTATNPGAPCYSCHMATYSGTGVNSVGGHTWRMVDTNDVENIAGCKKCHSTATNFDINGRQTEIEGLLTTLGDKIDLFVPGKTILVKVNGAWDGSVNASTTNKLKLSYKQTAALLNWTFIFRDRSMGVHNYKYTKALLANTIAALP